MAERGRVLATDDRPEILRVIERTLGSRFDCEFAASVPGAREKLKEGDFDLALCDIEMPGESGLTLAEEIVERHPRTAVVLVTGVDDPEVAETALEVGVHGYIVKPFWPGQLMITAMNALRRVQLESSVEQHRRALEDRLRVLMDRAPVSIYIKDRERRFVLANAASHEMTGREPGTMIGLHSSEIMSAEDDRAVAETDRMVLETGGAFEAEETLELAGRHRTLLTVKFPYVNDEGRVVGVYGISRDITDRKQAEELREELAGSQARAIEELRVSRQETVDRLALAIERHDAGTGVHIARMATVAAELGRLCGLDEERVLLLRAAAPMHDVGKVATPDAILRKPGPLTDEERAVMEQHTTIGHEILAGSDNELLRLAAEVALCHHERWDGRGYPRRLRGEETPLEARIVAVADVLDALLSDRSYRPAMNVGAAVALIRDGAGTQFDPDVVNRLLENLDRVLALRG
jgi:putative two-component system response regulator